MCEFGFGFGFTTTYYDLRLAEKSRGRWFVMVCVVIGSVLVLRHSIEDHCIAK